VPVARKLSAPGFVSGLASACELALRSLPVGKLASLSGAPCPGLLQRDQAGAVASACSPEPLAIRARGDAELALKCPAKEVHASIAQR
jgi:hypothetical protein